MAHDMQIPADDLTVINSTDDFLLQGYVAQFAAVEGGMVRCFACHTNTTASEYVIEALERSEGASDPDDMVANIAARCPACSAKGILTLKFGPDATLEEQDVFTALEDHRNTWSGGTSV